MKASLAFLDETGFLTVPHVGRTYAPIGQTPILKHRMGRREKVTVLGSLTLSPDRRRCGLYAQFLPGRGVTQEDLIAHLAALRRSLRRPLVVVLDNLPTHKGRQLREWCAARGDVHLEPLPSYAPELNPIEGVWSHGKCVTAAGRTVDDLTELEILARESVSAAREQHLLRGCLRGTKLPLRFDL